MDGWRILGYAVALTVIAGGVWALREHWREMAATVAVVTGLTAALVVVGGLMAGVIP